MQKFTKVAAIVAIIAIVLLTLSSWKNRYVPKVDPDVYQAVFFEGGQSYFGHLKNVGTRHPYLEDIYYIKSQTPAVEETAEQQFQLIKRGGEIHGPEDVLHLNWENVIFWENLRPDSKVVQGIAREKAQRAEAVQAASQSVAPAAPADPNAAGAANSGAAPAAIPNAAPKL